MAGCLDPENRQELLDGALANTRHIEDRVYRIESTDAAHESLEHSVVSRSGVNVSQPQIAVFGRFVSQLDVGSGLPRKKCLLNIRLSVHDIAALGGEAAIRETADALRDVARWWP